MHGSHGRARGGGPALGRSAPSSSASVDPKCSDGCRKPAVARDGPSGTRMALGGFRYGGDATWPRGIVLSCTHCVEREGVALPTGGGGGHRAGMTGSETEIAPCPNISPGWLCPWARRRAALGRARCGARRYRGDGGGGRPCNGGGGVGSRWFLTPLAWLPPVPLWHRSRSPIPTQTPSSSSPPRPCWSPRPPSARSSEAWAVARVAGRQSGHGTGQSLRYVNPTPCIRAGAAAGPQRG